MNSYLIIIGISILLLDVGLSGCFEETVDVTGDADKIEIIDYSVITKWHIPGYGTYQTYSKPGFYKDYPANAYEPRYIVSGIAKNIAGEYLDQIKIVVFFCDSNEHQLASENITIHELGNNYIKNFTAYLYSSNKYFKNIDYVKFHVSAP